MRLLSQKLFIEKNGLIVAMLIDKNGIYIHAVGINLDNGLIYDCKEKCVMELSIDNSLIYCGQNITFECFSKVGELWNSKAKFHG